LHSAHIFHAEVVVKATQFACAPFIIKNLIGRIVVEILFKPELVTEQLDPKAKGKAFLEFWPVVAALHAEKLAPCWRFPIFKS